MNEHKNPKPNLISKNFKFNSRNHADVKTISEYMTKLQDLTQYCDYGTVLNNMLWNRLVCGVNHCQIREKLFSEGSSLTFEKVLSIAISIEAAIKQSLLINKHQQHPQKSIISYWK